MAKKSVLITGLSGVIGGAVFKLLGDKYDLTALNRRDVRGVRCYRADIADLEAIRPAFADKEMVVHLAAFTGESWEDILHTNIVGCYNVFEASRLAGVQRIVFASSGAVVTGYENDLPYSAIVRGEYDRVPRNWSMLTAETQLRPINLYGASKIWGEALGRYYSEVFGISVICLRFGRVKMEDKPTTPRDFAAWCSLRDAVQMVDKCIAAPKDLHFDILYVISNNRWRYRDIEHARKVVGYSPQDGAGSYGQ